jgi:hypothetical protein
MRITTTENYYHDFLECNIRDCERHYCSEHRLLWRDCDTAKKGYEGDRDVTNGLHEITEMGDCPLCEKAERTKRFEAQVLRMRPVV